MRLFVGTLLQPAVVLPWTAAPTSRPASFSSNHSTRNVVVSSVYRAAGAPVDDDFDNHHHHRRRHILVSLIAAPLLLQQLQYAITPPPASAAASVSMTRLRPLTPEESAAVETAFSSTMAKAKAPVMLRLVFHDAGTFNVAAGNGGLNASIRFELDRPENFGLKRGFNVIEAAASKLKGTAAEGKISTADLIALAGARAVRITGGPVIDVPVGRVDATKVDPEGRLPGEQLNAIEQLSAFSSMGFSPQEFIALCGSHTLGSKGYGDPLTFDASYYPTLLKKPWENKKDEMAAMVGIPTDHVLPDDPTCRPIIEQYAGDVEAFYRDFSAAFLKLAALGVL